MSTSLTGDNHSISLETAIKMTQSFREKKDDLIAPAYQSKDVLAQAETFDRDIIDQILAQPDCVAIRIYSGLNDGDQLRAIIVGVNSNNEDLLPSGTNTSTDLPPIAEEGKICPPFCSKNSPLNQ